MAKTNAERQKDWLAKRKAEGYERFTVLVHPLDWPAVKRLVERLRKRRERK
jgi:hypothetical protein